MEKHKKGYHRNPNGSGSIYQRKDGKWCAQIQVGSDDGKRKIKYFYGSKRKEVASKLNKYKNISSESISQQDEKLTVDDFITNWLKNVKSNELKPSSYDRLESTINTHIVPNIGFYCLDKLTPMQIQNELINKMDQNKKSYSSIKKSYNALDACYKYALSIRKVIFNPVSAVSLPSYKKFKTKEITWFSDVEIKRFKQECIFKYKNGEYRYPLGYGMILILNTGLRLGEALAIKWSCVDFQNKQLSITSNMVMAINRDENNNKRIQMNQDFLKTKSSKRIIPLNDTAIKCLTEIKKIRYFGENSFVLCEKDGKQNKPRNFCRTFEKICKRAKIDKCGIHTLRHTFASKLFEKDVDVKTVSILLGHSDVTTTYNIYIHLIQKQKINAVKLLDNI